MKTLDEIKDEVAKERGFKDWDALFTACGSFSLERRMDIVAERYADQFKPKWTHIATPPTKEGTYLVIWKCGGKWVDQAITVKGENKVKFMNFDIEWWAEYPSAPERKEEGE